MYSNTFECSQISDISYNEINYRNRATSFHRDTRPVVNLSQSRQHLPGPMEHTASEPIAVQAAARHRTRRGSLFPEPQRDTSHGLCLGHPCRRQSSAVPVMLSSLSPPKQGVLALRRTTAGRGNVRTSFGDAFGAPFSRRRIRRSSD